MLTGLRKVLVIAFLIVVCACLLIFNKLDATNFADILKIIVPAFMGANLMEHINVKKN